jgi:hypothetical protein
MASPFQKNFTEKEKIEESQQNVEGEIAISQQRTSNVEKT